jgi:hypothetical protein
MSRVSPSSVSVLTMNGAIGRRAKTVGVIFATQTFQSVRNDSNPSGVVMILRSRSLHWSAVPVATDPDSCTRLTLGSAPKTCWTRR